MKITAIDIVDLRAPRPSNESYDGAYVGCLVRVATDAGIEGIAEIDSAPEVIKALVHGRPSLTWPPLFSLFEGQDPLGEPEALWDRVYEKTLHNGRRGILIHALSGIDIALWDLRGKAAGKSVAALMGVPRRDRVRAYTTLVRLGDTADSLKRAVDAGLARGANAIKLCSDANWRRDRALVERILRGARDHVGRAVPIMIDAYGVWKSADEVEPHWALFREIGIEWLEAPLPMDDLEGYARLSGRGIPITGGDMGLTTRFEFQDMAIRGKVEILQPDMTYVGGITEFRRTAALAKSLGRRIIPHGYKSNILLATNLAFLAQHDVEEWLEYSIAPSPLRWEMTREEFPIEADGRVRVPQGPGLGVTLNEETVAKYRVG